MPYKAGVDRVLAKVVQHNSQSGAPEQAPQAISKVMLPRVGHVLFRLGQVLPARFFSSLLSYFAADAVPFSCVTEAGSVKIANTHLQMGAVPARFPTLRKVPGILCHRIDVDAERSLGTVSAAERIIDQLKIGPTSFAESLGFQ